MASRTEIDKKREMESKKQMAGGSRIAKKTEQRSLVSQSAKKRSYKQQQKTIKHQHFLRMKKKRFNLSKSSLKRLLVNPKNYTKQLGLLKKKFNLKPEYRFVAPYRKYYSFLANSLRVQLLKKKKIFKDKKDF